METGHTSRLPCHCGWFLALKLVWVRCIGASAVFGSFCIRYICSVSMNMVRWVIRGWVGDEGSLLQREPGFFPGQG